MGIFFHIPYDTWTTPTSITSYMLKLREAMISFDYIVEMKVSS